MTPLREAFRSQSSDSLNVRSYVCLTCGEQYERSEDHVCTGRKPREVTCPDCGKTFSV